MTITVHWHRFSTRGRGRAVYRLPRYMYLVAQLVTHAGNDRGNSSAKARCLHARVRVAKTTLNHLRPSLRTGVQGSDGSIEPSYHHLRNTCTRTERTEGAGEGQEPLISREKSTGALTLPVPSNIRRTGILRSNFINFRLERKFLVVKFPGTLLKPLVLVQ